MHLATNTYWKNLKSLNLDDNSISSEGAKHLVPNNSWKYLGALSVLDNSINSNTANILR